MELWPSALVSVLLLTCAVVLLASHVRTWRRVRREEVAPAELDFRQRQFRRRMQTSAMMAVLAVAVFLGHWLTILTASRLFAVLFWSGILGLLVWLGLLALVDMLATKFHFDRLRQECLVEEARLHAQLRRMRAVRGNGQDNGQSHEDSEGEED